MVDVIFNLARRLPESIKNPLRRFYHRFSIKLEEKLIKDLMEYFSIDKKKTLYLLENGESLSADLWYCLNPKTKEDIRRFYEENPFYVFNLILWHGAKEQKNMREEFVNLAKGRVLDYGGGVGDMCMMAVDKKLEIDYADLSGKTFNFAKWLFKKRGYNIHMIDLSKNNIIKKYDTIFCIDVIEHVVKPKDLLKNLIDHLNKDGQLIITALDPIVNEVMPMHFKIAFNPEECLKSLGMVKSDESYLWVKRL